jgi:hypothetical protein
MVVMDDAARKAGGEGNVDFREPWEEPASETRGA